MRNSVPPHAATLCPLPPENSLKDGTPPWLNPPPAMTGARGTARVVLPQKAEPAYRECRGVVASRSGNVPYMAGCIATKLGFELALSNVRINVKRSRQRLRDSPKLWCLCSLWNSTRCGSWNASQPGRLRRIPNCSLGTALRQSPKWKGARHPEAASVPPHGEEGS
jgi:hypothetical protein